VVWIWALAQTLLKKSFVGGVCGSAATMNEGTQLFKLEDAKRLFEWLTNNEYNRVFLLLL
jgi:6-phosphofructokinase 2